MADNTPNVPGGAMPPKPAEAAKVQPKKETVRITLPPKPTAAPTVKLPSVAPTAAPAATAATSAPPTAAPAAPGTSLAARPSVAPPPPSSATRGAPASRAPAAPARPAPARSSGFDTVLAIAAGVVALAAAGMVYFLFMLANTEY